MRDLIFIIFILGLLVGGLKRPFIFVLGYVYIDMVAPQYIGYSFLRMVPWSALFAALSMGCWLMFADKRGTRFTVRQGLLLTLLLYCWLTMPFADFPTEAAAKWDWVWKVMLFGIFLPFTLTTRLRIEGLLLIVTLSAAMIIIVGGIKTIFSGGGYGELNLIVSNNTGLYESSIISMAAIALIPVILWLARYGTVFRPSLLVWGFVVALIFACLLIPIGTQARTGLVCAALVALIRLRDTRRPVRALVMLGALAMVAVPFLPAGFLKRMDTIRSHDGDTSATTRVMVWRWTIDYVRQHPYGGGFDAYRQNRLWIPIVKESGEGNSRTVTSHIEFDHGRAYHSAYFEMLGEQGYIGLALWLSFHLLGLIQMEWLRWRTRADPDRVWMRTLASSLQQAQIVYLVGASFVGIAYQSMIYFLIGAQIALLQYYRRSSNAAQTGPMPGARFQTVLSARKQWSRGRSGRPLA